MKKLISLVLAVCVLAAPVAAYADAEIPSPKQGAISMREQALATRLLPTRAVEGPYADRLYHVKNEEVKAGYFNMEGELVVPERYSGVSEFRNGYAVVSTDYEQYEIIDKNNLVVYSKPYLYYEPILFYDGEVVWNAEITLYPMGSIKKCTIINLNNNNINYEYDGYSTSGL